MNGEAVTTTYSIPEPFENGLGAVRAALAERNLQILGELDLSNRIRRSLRITLEPCVVFYVWPSAPILRAAAPLPSVGLFLPLHVVVSGCGTRTEIHLLKRPRAMHQPGIAAVALLQAEVVQALETIAMRRSLVS